MTICMTENEEHLASEVRNVLLCKQGLADFYDLCERANVVDIVKGIFILVLSESHSIGLQILKFLNVS